MPDHFGQVLWSKKTTTANDDVKLERSELQKKAAVRRIVQNGIRKPTPLRMLKMPSYPQMNGTDSKIDTSKENNDIKLTTSTPLKIGTNAIHSAISKDNNTVVLGDAISKYAIDNYNFQPPLGLGPFSRFEKSSILNFPDRLFEEYNSTECITNMGIFQQIGKAWLTVDNKLIIFNFKSATQDYFTIDEIRHSILTVKLIEPKPNVFVDSVNYLLLVSTPIDIYIFAVEYNAIKDKLEIFNTGMSVSTQGLIVDHFETFETTHDIFFCGKGDSVNVWKLSYSNNEEWFHKKCNKECLTRNSLSTVVPTFNKVPGLNIFGTSDSETSTSNERESISQMQIDQSRSILYTLSTRSVVRAYRIKVPNSGTVSLSHPTTKGPMDLLKDLSTTYGLSNLTPQTKNFKLLKIFPVTNLESNSLFLIAITNTGSRIFINGSANLGDGLALIASHLKLPPPDHKFFQKVSDEKAKQGKDSSLAINSNESSKLSENIYGNTASFLNVTALQLGQAQSVSELLTGLKNCEIISPNIFFGILRLKSENTDRLFVSTPDYGVLKKNNSYVEDFEFLDSYGLIHDIIQLTPTFNATETPAGYYNQFASQYTKDPLEVAVLTNTGIHIYRYRTPDLILEDSLNDNTFKAFAEKYGSREACSTTLYLSCRFGKSEDNKNKATQLFICGGQNASLNKNLTPVVDNVELSDRFYAVILLISRMFRDIWSKEIFKLVPEIKFDSNGFIEDGSVKKIEDRIILSGLTISRNTTEYLLSSLLIILDFLEKNKRSIPGALPPTFNYENNFRDRDFEVCSQAEHIGFRAIFQLLNTMKEGLSFLLFLIEESESSKNGNFKDLVRFMSVQDQADLSSLTFSQFIDNTEEQTQKLLKEILFSIINRNIVRGISVDLIIKNLQERCGSFCSTSDVLIFKAFETLKRAKDISKRDPNLKVKHLQASVDLLKQANNLVSFDTIKEAVEIMLEVNYYSGAIEFLLDMANASPNTTTSDAYSSDYYNTDKLLTNSSKEKDYEKRHMFYKYVFDILVDIDTKAVESVQLINDTENRFQSEENQFITQNGDLITEFTQLRDTSYATCFAYQDKLFHYEFYKWFIEQGVGERLLDIETPYILGFLQECAVKDLQMAKLLVAFHSKHENYYAAAKILYDLANSDFTISLSDRVQYLSQANGFCNCVCPPSVRQEMIEMSTFIADLIAVSNIQEILLQTIISDERGTEESKSKSKEDLDGKILTISELFNDFINPLGYYELALIVFRISDHRNTDDVLSQWELLLNKWHTDYIKNRPNESFYTVVSNLFVSVGRKLSDTETVFPVPDLFRLLAKFINQSQPSESAPVGILVDIFLKSGVTYDKLYYTLKEMVESTTFEPFEGFTKFLKSEMIYLIKNWYKTDRRLRDIVSSDQILSMTDYQVDTDPIYNYIRTTGIPI
ncbi:hypothetical protein LJB42_000765 [Komagataella kurtzmanii]|nr:hypothetical protein LJB42_000765 [Komagataella kurtzmanii]